MNSNSKVKKSAYCPKLNNTKEFELEFAHNFYKHSQIYTNYATQEIFMASTRLNMTQNKHYAFYGFLQLNLKIKIFFFSI